MKKTYGWSTPPDDIMTRYISKCKLFSENDDAFNSFRRDDDYKKILEGGEYIVGKFSLENIYNNYSEEIPLIKSKLEEFKENDIYGNPVILEYDIFGNICPCTIKYVHNALDIKSIVGNNSIKKVVEIGGGFGAMCKTLSVLYNFEEYIMIDLPDVISLAKKYLEHFPNISNKITYISCENFVNLPEIKDVDLFIADSSLAECDRETQGMYVDKILKNSKYGYIVYNTLHLQDSVTSYNIMLEKIDKNFSYISTNNQGVVFLFITKKDIYEK